MGDKIGSMVKQYSASLEKLMAVVKRPYTSPTLQEYGHLSSVTCGTGKKAPDSPFPGSQTTFFAPEKRRF
ncbi:MAG: hypothetical protein H5T68_10990 [Chloroflexi bacterium]|nr:hypothetical protein [Chloroflexota bacterium]